MKTIILQYEEDSEINSLIDDTLKIEQSSKVSLARRAIINYCKRVLQNGSLYKKRSVILRLSKTAK